MISQIIEYKYLIQYTNKLTSFSYWSYVSVHTMATWVGLNPITGHYQMLPNISHDIIPTGRTMFNECDATQWYLWKLWPSSGITVFPTGTQNWNQTLLKFKITWMRCVRVTQRGEEVYWPWTMEDGEQTTRKAIKSRWANPMHPLH